MAAFPGVRVILVVVFSGFGVLLSGASAGSQEICVQLPSWGHQYNYIEACFRAKDGREHDVLHARAQLNRYGDRIVHKMTSLETEMKTYCPKQFSCADVGSVKRVLAGLSFFESVYTMFEFIKSPDLELTAFSAQYEGLFTGLSLIVKYERSGKKTIGVGYHPGIVIYNMNVFVFAEYGNNGEFVVKGELSHSLSLFVGDAKLGLSLGRSAKGITVGAEARIRPLIGGRVEFGFGDSISAKAEYLYLSYNYKTLMDFEYSTRPLIESDQAKTEL